MRALTAILATIAILCGCTSHRQQPTAAVTTDAETIPANDIPEDSTMYNPGVLIINYTRTDSVRAALFAQVKRMNAVVIYDYNIINAIAVRLPQPHTLSATNRAIHAFKALPGILAVERDRIARLNTDR